MKFIKYERKFFNYLAGDKEEINFEEEELEIEELNKVHHRVFKQLFQRKDNIYTWDLIRKYLPK